MLAAEYVVTFDLSRRHALHLTYFTHGDTRKRGLALLRIKQTYRRFGYVLDDSELPDHLAVVLEFAATVDAGAGTRLLLEHRAGLELLGLALAEAGSPYAATTSAVSATLPALHGSVREAIVRLAAEGPPGEEVGLDPFVPPRSVQEPADERWQRRSSGWSCPTCAWRSSCWATCGATATTSSAGPPARRRCTSERLLRWGSPLFHFGILAVVLGHVMGLGVPKSWTEAVGISEGVYHFLAVSVGVVAGFCTVVGLAILIYRRRTVGPVFSATTRMDKTMYLFLSAVILLGLWNTVASNIFGHYDYRDGVSVWFRGIFRFDRTPS